MSVELSCETIGQLAGGAAALIIDAEIKSALMDLDNRGDDGKPRKVTILLTMTKKGDSLDILVDAKTAMPARKTNRTIAEMEASGRMSSAFFSPDAPGNPKQQVLPETDA